MGFFIVFSMILGSQISIIQRWWLYDVLHAREHDKLWQATGIASSPEAFELERCFRFEPEPSSTRVWFDSYLISTICQSVNIFVSGFNLTILHEKMPQHCHSPKFPSYHCFLLRNALKSVSQRPLACLASLAVALLWLDLMMFPHISPMTRPHWRCSQGHGSVSLEREVQVHLKPALDGIRYHWVPLLWRNMKDMFWSLAIQLDSMLLRCQDPGACAHCCAHSAQSTCDFALPGEITRTHHYDDCAENQDHDAYDAWWLMIMGYNRDQSWRWWRC